VDNRVSLVGMSTVKYAEWSGTCPVCLRAYPEQGRIARTPYGWAHERCASIWRAHRNEVLAASGRSR
jgi:hypothetical protein